MLFFEALKELHAGKQVRREAWAESEGYLTLMPGMKYVWKIVLLPNPNAGNFIFSFEDFESEDWVLVDGQDPFPPAVDAEKQAEAA